MIIPLGLSVLNFLKLLFAVNVVVKELFRLIAL